MYISLASILVFTRYCNRMNPSNGCSGFRNNALTPYMAHIHLWPPQSDLIRTPQTSAKHNSARVCPPQTTMARPPSGTVYIPTPIPTQHHRHPKLNQIFTSHRI
ncbi:hypothetical protein BDR07DRAFT_1433018 [Suillus spraguei]|nr:hypothetical protein BDR07DRAFT_1433018 [Suillus spraguei]